ncbi:hypothetical protein [Treponema zioleckii]|uniref:hypothetical protein n=1 Tax=Treponema zioleckii TaxID=331680 RepID=UPI00168AE2A7|nr:hypothetical protein [Treponema zioleckii]
MKEELYKSVKSLHDCNVEKIEIKQVAFSKDCPIDYPKDCFEIEIKIVKSEDIQSKNWIVFHFSDVEEFSIKKTPIWEWLIYDCDVIFEDGFYIFTIDDYIKIICSKIEYFAESK